MPEQGTGNGRRGKGAGRYGAATEGACCGRRGDERAIRRGGSLPEQGGGNGRRGGSAPEQGTGNGRGGNGAGRYGGATGGAGGGGAGAEVWEKCGEGLDRWRAGAYIPGINAMAGGAGGCGGAYGARATGHGRRRCSGRNVHGRGSRSDDILDF